MVVGVVFSFLLGGWLAGELEPSTGFGAVGVVVGVVFTVVLVIFPTEVGLAEDLEGPFCGVPPLPPFSLYTQSIVLQL